jgi:MOSC domain-containing protein YiiM
MVGLNTPVLSSVRIEHLFISGGHMYFGRHGMEPMDFPANEVDEVECVAGRGIKGDRFFLAKSDQKRQITFFSMEVYELMCQELGVHDRNPSVLRRNVFVRGADLNSLIGKSFQLQDSLFEGVEECRPCYWMDQAFGPGAETFLKGRGGLRARIVGDGVLRTSGA